MEGTGKVIAVLIHLRISVAREIIDDPSIIIQSSSILADRLENHNVRESSSANEIKSPLLNRRRIRTPASLG
jgi:hypothetical protein